MTNACAQYSLRANAEGEHAFTFEEFKGFCTLLAKHWCFQKERGDDGYVHWQGVISLIKKRRKDELLSFCSTEGVRVPHYCQPVSNPARGEVFYYTKADTRIEGPWKDTDPEEVEVYIPWQYRDIILYPWQSRVLASKQVRNFRSVNCILDFRGKLGKTTIAAIAELMHGAIDMPPCNNYEQLVASMCDMLHGRKIRSPGLVFVDIPRAVDQRNLAGLFAACEQIKKGKVYDQRYSYKQWWFDSPQIWVFTNRIPELAHFSTDRWWFWTVNEAKELVRVRMSEIAAIIAAEEARGAVVSETEEEEEEPGF